MHQSAIAIPKSTVILRFPRLMLALCALLCGSMFNTWAQVPKNADPDPVGIILTFAEVGDDVVATAEGSFDTTGLNLDLTLNPQGVYTISSNRRVLVGFDSDNVVDPAAFVELPDSSPFGLAGNSGVDTLTAQTGGPLVTIVSPDDFSVGFGFTVDVDDINNPTALPATAAIYLPSTFNSALFDQNSLKCTGGPFENSCEEPYVSGNPIDISATFEDTTVKGLGLLPGTYRFVAANGSYLELVITGEAWTPIDSDAVNAVVNGTNPTVQQYEDAGIVGAIEGNRSAYASALAKITFGTDDEANQQAIQALVDTYNAILSAADSSQTPTLNNAELNDADYAKIGVVVFASPGAVVLLNNAVAVGDKTDVDTVSEIQPIATAASTIDRFALAGGEAPVASDYKAVGFDVVDANVASYNSSLEVVPSRLLLINQFIVNDVITAFDKLLNGTALTEAEFVAIGILFSPSPTVAEISLINDGAKQVSTDISTVTEVQAIVTAAQRLLAVAGGDTVTPALTLADFQAIGVTGVTATNLASVVEELGKATASELDTVAKLTDALGNLSDPDKVAELVAFTGGEPPAAAVYEAAGVGGVEEDNLSAYASALAVVDIDEGDIQAIQAVVDTYNDILDAAESGNAPEFDQTDFAKIGVDVLPNAVALLNNSVASADLSDVDTVLEIQGIADAATRLSTLASAGTGKPTSADYSAVGITDVVAANAVAYNSAVAQTKANATVDIQNVVSAYNTILAAAGKDVASGLTAANYTNIGVDVDATHLGLLNSSVGAQSAAASNTTAKLQAMATAAAKILSTAANSQDAGLMVADFASLGIQGVSSDNLAAAIVVVAEASVGDVQTIASLQALFSQVLTPPLPVPTLSFWGILMLALMVVAVMSRLRVQPIGRRRF